jgi:hypothetical protein
MDGIQLFFVHGFILKKGGADPGRDAGSRGQRSFMVQQSYGLIESHGWLPDVPVFGVSGVNSGSSENMRYLSVNGAVTTSVISPRVLLAEPGKAAHMIQLPSP